MKNSFMSSNRQGVFIGVVLLLLSGTGVGGWMVWRARPHVAELSRTSMPTVRPSAPSQVQPTSPPAKAPLQSQTAPSKSPSAIARVPEVYRLRVENNQVRLAPTRIALAPGVPSNVALTQAIDELLANGQTADLNSTIPSGTRLLSLRVASQGIYVDLSREFTQGGGSESMVDRVAQVLYTATSLDPTAKVYLSVEGQLLDENHPLGGEGVILQSPLTRQQFAAEFKDIVH
ncbi:MAG: hypothetical protein HC780_01255 [Leptolyngbyaceae cyanobacterium CSU_1_3]|nr:hypothetical protein [Leptolyngbyaceae cyanobacterium CSU_1_3]